MVVFPLYSCRTRPVLHTHVVLPALQPAPLGIWSTAQATTHGCSFCGCADEVLIRCRQPPARPICLGHVLSVWPCANLSFCSWGKLPSLKSILIRNLYNPNAAWGGWVGCAGSWGSTDAPCNAASFRNAAAVAICHGRVPSLYFRVYFLCCLGQCFAGCHSLTRMHASHAQVWTRIRGRVSLLHKSCLCTQAGKCRACQG